jgi:cell division protein FtsB
MNWSTARGRELGQLKDENKAMKAKEDRLMEEVEKLKDETR